MKKVLFVMKALFAGGAEKQYRLIMEAIENCFDITVILVNLPSMEMEEQTKLFIKEHNRIHFIQLLGKEFRPVTKNKYEDRIHKVVCLLRQNRYLRKYIKNHRIDYVMYSYVTQLLITPMFKRRKICVVFNERNTGRQICDKEFKRKLLKQCDKVVTNSAYAARYIEELTGIACIVINNGINIYDIEKKEHDGFNILIPARVTKIKNQKIVVDAIKQVENGADITLILAGLVSDQAYCEEICKEAKNSNINIKVLGYSDKVDALYAESDLIILPSYEEGTPNVLLEAYMHGIMALASDIPMNRDCCTDDRILFGPNNAEQLARKIDLIRNNSLIKDQEVFFGENRKYVVENYSITRMRESYKKLFGEIG